jgi:hypothetical protein
MSREAMQIALEALEANLGNWAAKTKAVEVLRQALETEQEPVAWRSTSPDRKLSNKFACKPTESNWVEPLYTAPPKREWVGLTAYEIQEIYSGNQHWGNFACAIEAKLKERNG